MLLSCRTEFLNITKRYICYLKKYTQIKLKQLLLIFIWNHINNSLIMQKLHVLDFCLPHYLSSSDSEAMTLHKVSSLRTSFFKTLNKKTKLDPYLVILRVIPLSLSLLHRYYPDIGGYLSSILIPVVVVVVVFISIFILKLKMYLLTL